MAMVFDVRLRPPNDAAEMKSTLTLHHDGCAKDCKTIAILVRLVSDEVRKHRSRIPEVRTKFSKRPVRSAQVLWLGFVSGNLHESSDGLERSMAP